MLHKHKLIVIVGPTASGKSDLGIKIAKKHNGEIISADSRQVYRGMDIGTGKVTKKEQKMAKHHLLDVADPKKQFNASDFKKLGNKAIDQIISRHKIPIIVGGTGFYVDILLGQIEAAEVKPDKKLRAKLEKQSAEQLFKRLSRLDPLRAESIDRFNKRRLIRALEIFLKTKKSSFKPVYVIPDYKYDILWIGINPGKDILVAKIKKRLKARMKIGMVNEVRQLIKNGVDHKKLEAFGLEYRWISRYLRGEIDKKQMEDELYRDIVKYSKRQMTWFKRNKDIHWFEDAKTAERFAQQFLN